MERIITMYSETNKNINCWEFLNCDREAFCPVAKSKVFNGTNKGKAAGRICWAIENRNGDICFSKNPNILFFSCLKCSFYLELIKHDFEMSRTLN